MGGIKQGMILVIVAVVVGTALALALTRVLVGLLFGTKANDPVTFVIVVFVLSSVALAASYMAARRAIRLDPMAALRWE